MKDFLFSLHPLDFYMLVIGLMVAVVLILLKISFISGDVKPKNKGRVKN